MSADYRIMPRNAYSDEYANVSLEAVFMGFGDVFMASRFCFRRSLIISLCFVVVHSQINKYLNGAFSVTKTSHNLK